MAQGLTAEGFDKKNFEDIKVDIETTLTDSFGTINLNEESVFGQIVGIFAEREALLWYGLESIYNSMYADTANDFSLDNVCQYIGVVRLSATRTTAIAELTGRNQTTIPINSEASALGITSTFRLIDNVLITNDACVKALVSIDSVTQVDYTIIINGTPITYVTVINDTRDDIVDGLVTLIAASTLTVTGSNVDSRLLIVTDNDLVFNVFIPTGTFFFNLTVLGNFTANLSGQIPLPAGALNIIQTPIGGWISVVNPLAGATGRNLESDVELRARRADSLRLAGAGTIEAIRARLLNVEGVTAVTVNENVTDVISVAGLPPHSFEALVLGGDVDMIGDTIWKAKPAGIASYGNVQVNIEDSTGRTQAVYFSRPVNLYIYATIEVTQDATNTFPVDGVNTIKNQIAAQINALNVGDDVIYQSLYKSVFSVAGIESATIEIGGTLIELTPPTVSESNVVVLSSQIALTDISKITINVS